MFFFRISQRATPSEPDRDQLVGPSPTSPADQGGPGDDRDQPTEHPSRADERADQVASTTYRQSNEAKEGEQPPHALVQPAESKEHI